MSHVTHFSTNCTETSSPGRTSIASLMFKNNHVSCLRLVMKPFFPSCSLQQGQDLIKSDSLNGTRRPGASWCKPAVEKTLFFVWIKDAFSIFFATHTLKHVSPRPWLKCVPPLPASLSPSLISDTVDQNIWPGTGVLNNGETSELTDY